MSVVTMPVMCLEQREASHDGDGADEAARRKKRTKEDTDKHETKVKVSQKQVPHPWSRRVTRRKGYVPKTVFGNWWNTLLLH